MKTRLKVDGDKAREFGYGLGTTQSFCNSHNEVFSDSPEANNPLSLFEILLGGFEFGLELGLELVNSFIWFPKFESA